MGIVRSLASEDDIEQYLIPRLPASSYSMVWNRHEEFTENQLGFDIRDR